MLSFTQAIDMKKMTQINLLITLTFLFTLGLWIIDITVSYMNVAPYSTTELKIQSLIFTDIDPRISYHLGIILCVASFFTLAYLCVSNLMKNDKKEGEKNE
jgi:hypothetical protein